MFIIITRPVGTARWCLSPRQWMSLLYVSVSFPIGVLDQEGTCVGEWMVPYQEEGLIVSLTSCQNVGGARNSCSC